MGNIIEFNKNQNFNIIEQLLFKLIKNIEKYKIKNKNNINEKFLDLFYNLQLIYKKIKKNDWLTSKEFDKFINMFNKLLIYDDDFYRYNVLMEYIYIVDITKGKILENDTEYIMSLIDTFYVIDNIDINLYPDLIKKISNSKIKEIINMEDNLEDKNCLMVDIMEQFIFGRNILEIIMLYNNGKNVNMGNTKNGGINL